MHTAIVCQRTRMRGSTAPLRQDFVRCIEPDTGERQAKSQGERGVRLIRGQGSGNRDQGEEMPAKFAARHSNDTHLTGVSRVLTPDPSPLSPCEGREGTVKTSPASRDSIFEVACGNRQAFSVTVKRIVYV
jgi:hypothetical protein